LGNYRLTSWYPIVKTLGCSVLRLSTSLNPTIVARAQPWWTNSMGGIVNSNYLSSHCFL